MSTHIIAGRRGALPVGYVPRETATITANTPAAAVDRDARAQTISTVARRIEEKKAAMPQEPAPPRVRAVAVMPPKPPEPPPRVIRNADVIAVLPETEKAAMSRGDIANVMGLRGVEVDRLDNALTRLRKSGVAKVTKKRGSYAYYRLTADEARDVIPPRWQTILDILPDDPANGIPMTEVVEKFNAATGEQASKLAIKSMIEKLMMRRMVGPQHKVGTGYLRLYYRISGGNAMNAAIDPTIATLSHDAEIGQPHGKLPNGSGFAALGDDLLAGRNLPVGEGYTNRQELKPLPVVASELPDDSDIADAVAALAADTQARDLQHDSIEDEAPTTKRAYPHEPLYDLMEEMHARKGKIERNIGIVSKIIDATFGLSVTEAADIMSLISERLSEFDELQQRTAG